MLTKKYEGDSYDYQDYVEEFIFEVEELLPSGINVVGLFLQPASLSQDKKLRQKKPVITDIAAFS